MAHDKGAVSYDRKAPSLLALTVDDVASAEGLTVQGAAQQVELPGVEISVQAQSTSQRFRHRSWAGHFAQSDSSNVVRRGAADDETPRGTTWAAKRAPRRPLTLTVVALMERLCTRGLQPRWRIVDLPHGVRAAQRDAHRRN